MKPPILPRALSLLHIVRRNPFFGPELLKTGDICESAEESVVEDNNLLILGEQNIELHKVRGLQSCFYTLDGAFG